MSSELSSDDVLDVEESGAVKSRRKAHNLPTVSGEEIFGSSESESFENTKPYLVILSGRDQGKRFELGKQVNRFGRNQNADIVILDPRMSRNHGQLTVLPDGIFIEDHDSTNGTYVDGLRVDKKVLDTRSRIRIGNTLMKIDFKNPNEARCEDALYRAALTDPLTGLLNRKAFMTLAQEEIDLCRQNDLNLVIGMCDADNFKQINDTFGHPAGDYILQSLSRLFTESLTIDHPVGRYGGDEFIFLMRDSDSRTGQVYGENIRSAVENREFEFQGRKISCTISIGICCEQGAGIPNLEVFIQKADQALLSAKRNGRNRIETSPSTICVR